ncbi:glycosyltransferase [Ruminococcus flavefaciens]|uniref:Glycosyl transferase family 2 n=1 Tax=Ruminococcus flavefaciens TaxID=1265 RepID=A0A1M7IBM7_RUMFL|nr:glycosyltransferase [Ruminococcus flavefaciens]SHM38085.1 Glycosyl transferase family 2 [Ruminococcus flavefaciens]
MVFTFCSLTFNQESMIIEHLESIKYQIIKYGKGIDIEYVLADDHSKDNTVLIVKRWLKKNDSLFKKITISVAEANQGTVKNYINALNLINTEYYKILAGDDLFYRNNIFKLISDMNKSNIILTPIMYYDETDVGNKHYNYNFFRSIIACGNNSESIKHYLARQYQYSGKIPAPGVFVKKELIDQEFFKALDGYTLIEDAPQFNYHIHQSNSRFASSITPYILYRVNSGVSHKTPSKAYLNDVDRIDRCIHTKKASSGIGKAYCKFLERFLGLSKIIVGFINSDKRKELLSFNKTINKEMRIAGTYLNEIKTNAQSFIKDNR